MFDYYKPEEPDASGGERFTALVDKVLAVPHSVIKARVEAHKREAAKNPDRPGPKPKKLAQPDSTPDQNADLQTALQIGLQLQALAAKYAQQ